MRGALQAKQQQQQQQQQHQINGGSNNSHAELNLNDVRKLESITFFKILYICTTVHGSRIQIWIFNFFSNGYCLGIPLFAFEFQLFLSWGDPPQRPRHLPGVPVPALRHGCRCGEAATSCTCSCSYSILCWTAPESEARCPRPYHRAARLERTPLQIRVRGKERGEHPGGEVNQRTKDIPGHTGEWGLWVKQAIWAKLKIEQIPAYY